LQYLEYLRHRWSVPVIACAVGGAAALGVSLLLPKQYTATASVLIESPAAGDARASTAVSPVYLESLKTYEHFAESDTLFLEALQRFNLRAEYPSAAVDGLKRRVLKVTKPRDTKILQISATLTEPAKAQALAQFIAQRTVDLNAAVSQQSDQDAADEARRQFEEAAANVRMAEKALTEMSEREPYESVQDEVDSLAELRTRLRKAILDDEVDAADYGSQGRQADVASLRARIAILEKQTADVESELAGKERLVAERRTRWEQLRDALTNARQEGQTAESRMHEMRLMAGNRSERLRVIDPGIVPGMPSSPHVTLNVAVAVLGAAVFCWLYLTVAFNLRVARERHFG